MQEKCTRFLIDSNLFIAAVKSRWTKSSELLALLLNSPAELVANKALLSGYEKYAIELGAEYINQKKKWSDASPSFPIIRLQTSFMLPPAFMRERFLSPMTGILRGSKGRVSLRSGRYQRL